MDLQELRNRFEAHGIRRVKVGGFDLDGVLRGKYMALDKFWSVIDHGFGFCDVIFGWDIADTCYDTANATNVDTGYPDIRAKIDVDSFRVLPYEQDTAAFLLDFYGPDKKAHPACPRNLLKRIVARAESQGWLPYVGAEFEFWVFRETSDSMREKGYRNLTPISQDMFGYSWLRTAQHQTFVRDLLDACERFAIPIEALHTETGPGVYEVAIRYGTALATADAAALFKTLTKEVASRHQLSVTFMAKWNAALPGSSGHLHQSLRDSTGQKNLIAEDKGSYGLSTLGRHYLGGLLAGMADMTAVVAPTINSYKRYVKGVWAPLAANWGVENRTAAIRLIRGDSAQSTRFEYRQTAADMNPYTAIAASLGSGLQGIAQAIEPLPESRGEIVHQGATPLPMCLKSATELLKQSQFARTVLGEPFVDHYVRTREWEVRQYEKAVTDWELKRYFESI